jgi:hypothetical protein
MLFKQMNPADYVFGRFYKPASPANMQEYSLVTDRKVLNNAFGMKTFGCKLLASIGCRFYIPFI